MAPEAPGHEFPSVALAANGSATVVWQGYGERGRVSVDARRITRSGSLSRTVRLGRMDGGGGLPTVASSAGGTVVVWPGAASYAKPTRVWAARRAGGWQDPEPLSARGSIFGAEAAVTATGAILATWGRYPADGPSRVEVAERPAGGAWQPAALLPSGADGLDPVVATSGDGDAVVAWRSFTADRHSRTAASIRSAGGAWEPATFVSAAGTYAWFPQVVMDGAGAVTVAWEQRSGGRAVVAARRDPVAGWLPAETLTAADEKAAEPALGVAGDGSVTAVGTRLDGTNRVRGSRLG